MQIPTNTPIKHVPDDYCPAGSETWFTLPSGKDEGKTIFYMDHQTGEGSVEATFLLVHGNPENSYTYRHVRDSLIASGKNLRIVIPDHVGFGLSDQADFEMVDMHHADNLRQLVEHLDLRDVTLLVHDWGGPIGVGAMMDDPARVRAFMVVNSTIFPMPEEGLVYTNFPYPWFPWAMTPKLIPVSLWGGVAASVVKPFGKMSFASFMGMATKGLSDYARKKIEPGSPAYIFSEQFRTRANALASTRHVKQTPVWGHGYRYKDKRHGIQDNHAFYEAMQKIVPEAWKDLPAAGLFGQWDPCGKDEVIAQWCEALPRMADQLSVYLEESHFIEEAKGPEIAEMLLAISAAAALDKE